MLHGESVVDGQADILYHLSGVQFHHQDAFLSLGGLVYGLRGEGPEGDGADPVLK